MPPPQIVLHARSALVTMLSVANSDLLSILPRQWLDYPEMIQGIVCARPGRTALRGAHVHSRVDTTCR